MFSEETLTGVRRMTSRAYLTFVAIDRDNRRMPIPALILETDGREAASAAEADRRRPSASRRARTWKAPA